MPRQLLAHQCADENEYQTSFTLLSKIAVSLTIIGLRILVVHVGGEEFIVDARPQTNYPAFSITVRKIPLIRVE